jgi:hypothetical protein
MYGLADKGPFDGWEYFANGNLVQCIFNAVVNLNGHLGNGSGLNDYVSLLGEQLYVPPHRRDPQAKWSGAQFILDSREHALW